MMPVIGVLVLLLLVWGWWFDRYRRRPRGRIGEIDDYAPGKARGPHWAPMPDEYHKGGG